MPDPKTQPAADFAFSWRTLVLFLLTLVIVGLCGLITYPFLPAITGAVALTVAIQKPYDWLERRIHKPTLTAGLGVLLVVALIVTPVLIVVQSLGQHLIQGAALIQSGAAQDWITQELERVPTLNQYVDQALGIVSAKQAAQGTAGYLATRLRGILTGSVATATQLALLLFTLFFLLKDRKQAAALLRSLLPMPEDARDYLLSRMRNTIEATLHGSLSIAAIQGTLGGVMFWILGVPSALICALLMAILATIPSLGTFLVWMPVSVYLFLSGHWVKAVVLVAWGTFVIGTVDNLLYPTLVGKKMQLHTVPVLFAVLGGIGVFGISGIVLGPLLLTTAVALLHLWSGDMAQSE